MLATLLPKLITELKNELLREYKCVEITNIKIDEKLNKYKISVIIEKTSALVYTYKKNVLKCIKRNNTDCKLRFSKDENGKKNIHGEAVNVHDFSAMCLNNNNYYGILSYTNGNIYKGHFNSLLKANGHGILKFASGDKYEGNWKNDKRHGQGTYNYFVTGSEFVGNYINGKQHGTGIMYGLNGNRSICPKDNCMNWKENYRECSIHKN